MNYVHFAATGRLPLLILHGLFGSSRNWNSFARKVASELKIPVFALDLRNHNLSENNTFVGTMQSWTTFRDDLVSFVNLNLNNQPFFLLGHSLVRIVFILMSRIKMAASREDKSVCHHYY